MNVVGYQAQTLYSTEDNHRFLSRRTCARWCIFTAIGFQGPASYCNKYTCALRNGKGFSTTRSLTESRSNHSLTRTKLIRMGRTVQQLVCVHQCKLPHSLRDSSPPAGSRHLVLTCPRPFFPRVVMLTLQAAVLTSREPNRWYTFSMSLLQLLVVFLVHLAALEAALCRLSFPHGNDQAGAMFVFCMLPSNNTQLM